MLLGCFLKLWLWLVTANVINTQIFEVYTNLENSHLLHFDEWSLPVLPSM